MRASTAQTLEQAEEVLPETRALLCGQAAIFDPAGALWLPEQRCLVVADLHFEKAASYAPTGQFLPPYDSFATLNALTALIERRKPQRIICLGDSFHDRRGANQMPLDIHSRLRRLQVGRDWIWIAGNHDPDLPDHLGGKRLSQFVLSGLCFRHEPTEGTATGEVAGHLHPAAKIRQRGRTIRRPAFVTDGQRLILPAFGYLTGGLNVLENAISNLFKPSAMRTFAIGTLQIYPIAPAMLRPDRFSR